SVGGGWARTAGLVPVVRVTASPSPATATRTSAVITRRRVMLSPFPVVAPFTKTSSIVVPELWQRYGTVQLGLLTVQRAPTMGRTVRPADVITMNAGETGSVHAFGGDH